MELFSEQLLVVFLGVGKAVLQNPEGSLIEQRIIFGGLNVDDNNLAFLDELVEFGLYFGGEFRLTEYLAELFLQPGFNFVLCDILPSYGLGQPINEVAESVLLVDLQHHHLLVDSQIQLEKG